MTFRSLPFLLSVAPIAKKCLDAGFDGFLPKPVSRQKLVDMMERLLGQERNSKSEQRKIATQYSLREEAKHLGPYSSGRG